MLDPRDVLLQNQLPVLPVPLFGPLAGMDANGERLLIAANGVFLQVRRDWLDWTERIAPAPKGLSMPFGQVCAQGGILRGGPIPERLIERFVAAGRAALPNEIAGSIVLDSATGAYDLRIHPLLANGPAKVDSLRPTLARSQSRVVDLHTHGLLPAIFSGKDNRDDQGVVLAGVFGQLDRERFAFSFRLCLNGLFVPLTEPCGSGRWTRAGVSCGALFTPDTDPIQ